MDAAKYYRQASDQLIALRQQNPESQRFSLALADCYNELARISVKTDRAAAADYLTKARAAYQQMAAEHKDNANYQIDWLESELTSATLAGFDSAQEHLARIAEIDRSLASNWPSDTAAAYRLACYLTAHEPSLAPREPSSSPAQPQAP
jgi:hypothetical protein